MLERIVSGFVMTLLLISVLTLAFNILYGESLEPPPTQWNRTYGGMAHEAAFSVIQTSDGGYALAGLIWTSAERGDFWLVKVDANGLMEWSRTYGDGTSRFYERGCFVIQTKDGGYALAGSTNSSDAGLYDFWMGKTDSFGNMLWNRTYGGTDDDIAASLVETSDGGYALAGYTYSFGAGLTDFWMVKTDAAGNMQWNKTYGGVAWDDAGSVVQTSDGGYALAGRTIGWETDFWLVKTDQIGNMLWNRTFGGSAYEAACDMIQTGDGGYALAGYTYTAPDGADRDFMLVKADSNGNMQWNKTYGGTSVEWADSLAQSGVNGYAIAGYTCSFGAGGLDFWLVKTDTEGNMQWNTTYGGASNDEATCIIQTNDGGLAIAGSTYSFAVADSDFWLVKVEAASVETSVKVQGKDYPVTVVSNTTIDQIVATANTLHFKSSGPAGQNAYINITFSMVNTTEIKVFIDGQKLTPPPFPVISSNGTHYFIYLEFTLSTHDIEVQFASQIPVGGKWVPINGLQLLTLFMSLVATVAIAASFVGVRRIKKRQD